MKQTIIYPAMLLLTLTLVFSCKKPLNYKFEDKPQLFECDGTNAKLLNEAIYSFEEDLRRNYGEVDEDYPIDEAHYDFISGQLENKIHPKNLISKHSYKVFKLLMQEQELWRGNNSEKRLSYNSKVVKCISENITHQSLKATFNALLITNTLSPQLFGTAVLSKYDQTLTDKNLTLYVALDMYYAKMYGVDFSKTDFETLEKKQAESYNGSDIPEDDYLNEDISEETDDSIDVEDIN